MSIEVGSLVVEMSANVARLQADVNKATGIFGSGMREMQKAAEHVQNQLNMIAGSQFIHAVDLVARRGKEAFDVLKRSAIDSADELNKLSQKTGFAVESLAGLKYAASLSDLSLEALTKGLKGLSQNMAEARGGSKEMATLFGKLGISLESSDEALLQLAERFAGMDDGFEKTALAVKVFGKEGLNLIPFLNQGREGIAALTEEARRFGLVIDSVTAQQAEAFNDNLRRLQANAQGLMQQLGNSMIPVLLDASEAFLDAKTAAGGVDEQIRNIVGNRDDVEQAMEATAQAFANVYSMMMPVIVGGRLVYEVFRDIALEGAAWAAQIAALADGNITGFMEIRRAAQETAESNRKSWDEFVDRITVSANGANAAMAKFFEEHRRTVRVGNQKYLMETIEDAKALQEALAGVYRQKGPGRPTGVMDGLGKEKSEYEKLTAAIREKTAAELAEADAGAALAEQEKFALKIMTDLGAGTLKLSDAEKRVVAAMLEELLAAEKLNQQRKREIELQKARDAEYKKISEGIEAWRKKTQEIEFEISVMALSNDERERAILLHELEAKKVAITTGEYAISAQAYEELREKMLAALGTRAEMRRAMGQQVEVWQGIERTAHDTFISIFDSGKDAFTRLRDTLKNTLYELLYQMTLKKWIINLSAGVSGTGVASQAFGATADGSLGNLTSGASGGLNLINAGSSLWSAYSGGMTATAGSLASGLGFTELGAGIKLAGTGLGAEAGGMYAIGETIGAALPYIGAAMAVVSILGGLFGKSGERFPTTLGEASGRYDDGRFTQGGLEVNWGKYAGSRRFGSDMDVALSRTVQAFTARIGGLFDAFGMEDQIDALASTRLRRTSGRLTTGFQADLDGDGPGGLMLLLAKQYGGDAEIEQALSQYINDVMTIGIKKAIELSGLPVIVKDLFAPLTESADIEQALATVINAQSVLVGAGTSLSAFLGESAESYLRGEENLLGMLDRVIGGLMAVNPILEDMGQSAFAMTLVGGDAAAQLAALAGGLDAFASKTQAYYNAYFTEEERAARLREKVAEAFASADIAMPDTREEFRAIVESLDLTTDAGRKTFAALMELSPAFAAITETVTTTVAGVSQAVLDARQKWQDELALLTGAATDRSLALRDQADPATRDLMQALWAEQDRQAAARAAAELATTNADWQTQIDLAAGAKTQRQADIERDLAAAADESTRTLIRQYYAQLDVNDAAEAARQAQEQAAQAQARAAEQAASAAQRAAEEQARAAEQVRRAWQSAADGIVGTMRKLRGDLLGDSPQGIAALQADFAIATAAARAGDIEAAKRLPELASAVTRLGVEVADSRLAADRLVAGTYNSLDSTIQALKPYGIAIPGFAGGGFHEGGLRFVGERGMELEATGPARYWSASQTSELLSGNGLAPIMRALVAEVTALRAEVASLRGQTAANGEYARRTSDNIEMVTQRGRAILTEAAQ